MPSQEGADFAKSQNLLFLETSAVSANNVGEIFAAVASQIAKKIQGQVIDTNNEEFGVRKVGSMSDAASLRKDRINNKPDESGGCC